MLFLKSICKYSIFTTTSHTLNSPSIPGALSRKAYPSFNAALHFAQEYAILIASSEDRPCVPAGVVIFPNALTTSNEPCVHDLKACFRTWDDKTVDTATLMGGSSAMQGGILKLADAIAAVRTLN